MRKICTVVEAILWLAMGIIAFVVAVVLWLAMEIIWFVVAAGIWLAAMPVIWPIYRGRCGVARASGDSEGH